MRFLQGNFAVEVKNGRLNGSSKDVEQRQGSGLENICYTKKIRSNEGVFPYASAQHVKKNIKEMLNEKGYKLSTIKALGESKKTQDGAKVSQKSASEGNPYYNIDENIMGFMNADSIDLTEEEYNDLDKISQFGFKKETKKGKISYKKNITKKRKAALMLTPLQAIGHTRIEKEYCTKQTDKNPMIYTKEIYSTNMSSTFNLNISQVGRFTESDDTCGFRDYNIKEAKILKEKLGVDSLNHNKETRFNCIRDLLKAIQHYNSKICTANNLEDLNSKFIILCEYSIGNNIFCNIFKNHELNIDYLTEAINENEDYRLSKIYIGVRSGFMTNKETGKDLKNIIIEAFGEDDRFKIGSVQNAFDGYLEYLNETLEELD